MPVPHPDPVTHQSKVQGPGSKVQGPSALPMKPASAPARSLPVTWLGVVLVLLAGALRGATYSAATAAPFTDRYCSSCRNDVDKEGGLDLTTLKFLPNDSANFLSWVRIHDRVASGEMPPKEKKRPVAGDLRGFLGGLSGALIAEE